MERTKENAFSDFMEMIRNSWTYDRMTEKERRNLDMAVEWAVDRNAIKGSYKQQWMILHAIYEAFLAGLGYTGGAWREPDQESIPAF